MYVPLTIHLENSLFRGQKNLMRLICRIIFSPSFHHFGLGLWGSFELNSQMAPSLSQIHVLSTSTMSSFAPEAREEYTGHEISRFLQ